MTRTSRTTASFELIVVGVLRRWRALLAILTLAPLLAWMGWGLAPDRYEARARVTVQDPETVNPFLADLSVDWDADDRAELITSILRSPSTLEGVVRELGVVREDATREELELAVRSMGERMTVTEVGGGVVLIKLHDPDPAAALHGVERLLEAFVREMLRPQRENVAASAQFLEAELSELEREVRSLEVRITHYRQEHADALPEMRDGALAEHRALRMALLAAETRGESGGRQVAAMEERLRSMSTRERILEPLLSDAETRLARALSEHHEPHPEVALARERVESLTAQLRAARAHRGRVDLDALEAALASGSVSTADGDEVSLGSELLTSELLAYRQLVRERTGASAEASLLRDRIEHVEARLTSSVAVEEELGRLQRELAIRRGVYEDLLGRYEQARVIRDLAVDGELQQVWVLEPPVLPTRSSKPPRWLVVLGALLGGLALSVVWVAAGEMLSSHVRQTEEAREAVGASAVATLPRLRGDA